MSVDEVGVDLAAGRLVLAQRAAHAELHRVRVYETPDLFVDFYGEA